MCEVSGALYTLMKAKEITFEIQIGTLGFGAYIYDDAGSGTSSAYLLQFNNWSRFVPLV